MTTRKFLAESKNFVLSHDSEICELLHKQSKNIFHVGDHYGDPACGLMAPNETWCITGGEGLILRFLRGTTWTGFRLRNSGHQTNKLQFKKPEDLCWLRSITGDTVQFVHDMRIESSTSVRILLDPYADFASIWSLDVVSKTLTKIEDGPSMQDQMWIDDKVKF